MFVKKGTELKLKTKTELSFDKSLLFNGFYFSKGSMRLTKQMINIQKIVMPTDCELKNGFFFDGYYWYDWMFNLNNLRNTLFLKTE